MLGRRDAVFSRDSGQAGALLALPARLSWGGEGRSLHPKALHTRARVSTPAVQLVCLVPPLDLSPPLSAESPLPPAPCLAGGQDEGWGWDEQVIPSSLTSWRRKGKFRDPKL